MTVTYAGPLSLVGRVAVVFGSATNIGAATAKTLAHRGAAVVLADLAAEAAEQRAREIAAIGGEAIAVSCDVQLEAQVAATIDLAVRRYGGLDILHNNAAAMDLARADVPVAETDPSLWDRTLAVNLRGQMFGCKYAIPALRRRGGGSIINTSSSSSLVGDVGLTAYGVSKAAVNQLTRTVATQYGRDRIRCNAVVPGLIAVQRPPGHGMAPEDRRRLGEHQVLPYNGTPEDVAEVVAFLASDAARFITGHLLVVDGGLTIHQPTFAEAMRAAERT